MSESRARVVLLAGPSGSGKSFVARQTGLPILYLDDFYKDGDDPTLPCVDGRPDWESPRSWDATSAVRTIVELCTTGQATVPVYSIGTDRRVGGTMLDLGGAPLFVAEGIFAAEIVAECARLDVLAAAFAVRRHRAVTFVRRLARDLAERRKPPALLIRRGLTLYTNEPRVLARQAALGALPAGRRAIERAIAALRTAPVEAAQR